MSTPKIDKKTMMKGFRKVGLAMPLMFVGPIVVNSSFKNQSHPYYYYVLSIGIAICLFAMLWFFLGVNTIVKGIFNDNNQSE